MFHKKEWQILLCKQTTLILPKNSLKLISSTMLSTWQPCHNLIKRNKMANCFNQCDRDKIYFKR